MRTLLLFALWAAAAPAQERDDLPVERVQLVAPGSRIDLDTGLAVPERAQRGVLADVRFDRDGAGFFVEPLNGGMAAGADDVEPAGEWSPARIRVPARDGNPVTLFARTDRGVARVTLFVADGYSTGAGVVRWSVVPPRNPVFLPPPTELAAEWHEQRLVVTWTGDYRRWLVEVRSGETVAKHTVDRPRIALEGLATAARHHVLVRGVTDTDVSLPAEVVQHGPRQNTRRAVVEFAGRWHDRSGGLVVSRAAEGVEDAEIVFYLYGVYVPGGGVRKMGQGETAFRELTMLPAVGYAPVYGRLDADDVLAVRIADGRYAKLWLRASDGQHVTEGVRVHFAFLPDGRRALQPQPMQASVRVDGATAELRWNATPGAARFRVTPEGRKPLETATSPLRVEGLPAGRMVSFELAAIGGDGEASDPVVLVASTHGPAARTGSTVLKLKRGGFSFATGAVTAEGQPCDLTLTGSWGSGSTLQFQAAGGIHGGEDRVFGDLDGPPARPDTTEWTSDAGKPDCDRFYVHTADGGCASVRVTLRDSTPTIEYVWLPGALAKR